MLAHNSSKYQFYLEYMSRYISAGRTEDLNQLYELWEHESNPDVRANIKRTMNLIQNEDRLVTSMRESLVRAHRNGDTAEIADIHDFIKGKQKYGR